MNQSSEQLRDTHDTAGVGVPPPLLFAGVVGFGLAVGRALDAHGRSGTRMQRLGTASMIAGFAIGGAAIATMRRARTNVSPFKPSTALVTEGVYRFSRNPIYVGMTAISIGVALRARSLLALALVPVALALLDGCVVDREERYLEQRFGETFRSYRDAVPRWF